VFYAARIFSTLMMMVVGLMMQAKMPPNPAMTVALVVFGCAAGWVLPRSLLAKKVVARQETLRLSLPDALDLLVVSVEAGLGLDQAIQHVARELQLAIRSSAKSSAW
jgi:tight adherence protein C